jgi:MtN3 and saliva related transmembrane protein
LYHIIIQKKPGILGATEIIGIGASVFTSVALMPQLFKIIKEKDAEGTSYGMLGVLFVGLCLWTIYGVLKDDLIIIIANSFSLLVNVTVGILTLVYRKRPGKL